MTLENVVGDLFSWMRQQSLSHAQLHAAHEHFKTAVKEVVGTRKLNSIMKTINEVVQNPVWNKNDSSSNRKCRNAIHALLYEGTALLPAYSCENCMDKGIVIRCSGFGAECQQHFHYNCASSFVEQSKGRAKSYYCTKCTGFISASIKIKQFEHQRERQRECLHKTHTSYAEGSS